MSEAGMAFSNAVGGELTALLTARATAELGEVSERDRLTAMMGAALIAVAEVLRDPVEAGADVDGLVDFASRWLRTLLEPVAAGDEVSG